MVGLVGVCRGSGGSKGSRGSRGRGSRGSRGSRGRMVSRVSRGSRGSRGSGGPTTPYLPPLECTRLDDLKHTHHSAALLRAQLLDDAVEYPHPITPVLELGAWPHDVTWLGVGVGVGVGLGLGLGLGYRVSSLIASPSAFLSWSDWSSCRISSVWSHLVGGEGRG